MGVGAPPLMRSEIPQFVPTGSNCLRGAVGDVCSQFYDRAGDPIDFEGSDDLIAVELEALRHIPVTIAVAVGRDNESATPAHSTGVDEQRLCGCIADTTTHRGGGSGRLRGCAMKPPRRLLCLRVEVDLPTSIGSDRIKGIGVPIQWKNIRDHSGRESGKIRHCGDCRTERCGK